MSPCFANPDVLPLDHEVNLIENVKNSVQVKSQIVQEKLFHFFFNFQKKKKSLCERRFQSDRKFKEDDHA
jgi:hypothetical protein